MADLTVVWSAGLTFFLSLLGWILRNYIAKYPQIVLSCARSEMNGGQHEPEHRYRPDGWILDPAYRR